MLRAFSSDVRRPLVLLAFVLFACSHGQRPTVNGERFDDPDEAAGYFAAKRGITPELDLNARYAAARAHAARMRQATLAAAAPGGRLRAEAAITQSGAWQFLGPGNVAGRTRALLIDPNNPNVMYAGAVSGGVWKTIDGGASWSTVTDFLPNIAVCALAFDPNDSRTLYAGTGEGYFREVVRGTNVAIRGNGIFVSRDAGTTWRQLPATTGEDFYWVNDVAVSAHDSQRIYAATRSGVFRSLDGGATWTRVLPTAVNGGCLDLALRSDTPNDFLFASCGTLAQSTVYRSTAAESDGAWTAVLSQPGMARTSLAIAPSNPSVIYALAAQNGDPGSWTVRTQPGAAAADQIGPLLLTNVSTAVDNDCTRVDTSRATQMGWHCNVIAVDPQDADRVWAGGVDLFRSDDGGRTWGIASYWWARDSDSSFVHADQHVIAFHPAFDGIANQTMFVTGDGGIFRTDNARAAVATGLRSVCHPDQSSVAFHSLNHGLGTTQFYAGAVFDGGTSYFGGAQDNGTVIGTDGHPDQWSAGWGGDGGFVAVDPVDHVTRYAESQNARIARSTNGGAFLPINMPSNDTFLFITPFLVDPVDHNSLWLGGGSRLWHGNSFVGTWTAASPALPSGSISAVTAAPSGAVLFGTTGGPIYRGSTSQWQSAKPRDGWVSSLTFDAANSSVAYATYATFGGTHVWKTLDGGATWTPLDGSGDGALPDVPAHSLAVDGPRLYLGTDIGIFVSTDGGATWAAESTFPHAITEAVLLAPTARGVALFAFTHGRGAWRVDLAPAARRRSVSR